MRLSSGCCLILCSHDFMGEESNSFVAVGVLGPKPVVLRTYSLLWLRFHSWQCGGWLYGVPRIKPWFMECKENTFTLYYLSGPKSKVFRVCFLLGATPSDVQCYCCLYTYESLCGGDVYGCWRSKDLTWVSDEQGKYLNFLLASLGKFLIINY